ATAEELGSQAAQLQELMTFFQLAGNSHSRPVAPPTRAQATLSSFPRKRESTGGRKSRGTNGFPLARE
ncbi:MAG: hypothetical protein ABTS16_14290, partial [Candidatus Accumulibacter phosphatis]